LAVFDSGRWGRRNWIEREHLARLWVLSASRSQRREVEKLLASIHAPSKWFPQRHTPHHFQLIGEVSVSSSALTSNLARTGCVFEVEGSNERFLYHPGLGVHRQAIDDAGEVVIRAEQVALELVSSGGNLKEFERRLRLLQGTPWLDLLEPYRLELLRLQEMPRAV
jgi:hypothetical protein